MPDPPVDSAPTKPGGVAGALCDAKDDEAKGPPPVVLPCKKVAPEIEVSVPPDFGAHIIRQNRSPIASDQTIIVKSVGTADLVVGQIKITGTDKQDYEKLSDAASKATLPPGAEANLKVGFGPSDEGSRTATLEVPSNATSNPKVERGLTGKGLLLLKLTKVDDHFCPKQELLDITYELKGFSTRKVMVEITSKYYGSNPLFERELTADERTDGTHTIHWDGCVKTGDLKDRCIHPLLSPYKVHLYHDATYTGELEFKVLYHSVLLKKGPWTPDEKEPPKGGDDWAAYKLNELGYWGGPVGKDFDDYLKKAVIRYKANHKKFHKTLIGSYDGTIDGDLQKALDAKDNDRKMPPFDAIEDSSKNTTILIEELTYERLSDKTDEFGTTRPPHEKKRLNRPLIPIEAEIWLKKKDDSKACEPLAVGPCRVDWKHVDPDEDLSRQYTSTAAEPSQTQKYIEKALKQQKGRTGTNGDNCPSKFAGIRAAPADNWKTPFLVGDQYIPHPTHADGGNKVVHSTAVEDKDKYPKRLGRAGIMLRPSYIAGDDYQVKAHISFLDMPNQKDLEKFHGVTADEKTWMKAESGTFTNRRFAKVVMSIDWPARTNSYEWDEIATDFEKSFLDVDVGNIVTKKMTDVLTEADYKDIVTKNTTHKNKKKITFYDDAMVGVAIPKQGKKDADTYKGKLSTYTNDLFNEKIQDPLGRKIDDILRKDHPTGFIVANFLLHKPVDIMNNPKKGDKKVTAANKGFVTWGGSIGLADSTILLDQKDPDKVYYVVSHEMGHNLYLLHWENTGENNTSNHDQKDHNCTMSYSDSSFKKSGHFKHQEPGKYTPHFCGKCDLALRGWDITSGGMAKKSKKGPEIVTPSVAAPKDVVVVKNDDTNPKRRLVTFKADTDGAASGQIDRSNTNVKLFTKETKGTEITFDGADNVFKGAKLASGVKLFAEAASAGDTDFTLTLTEGAKKVNPAATQKITALEVTLDIFDKAGVALSKADKIKPGRPIHVQDKKTGKRLRAQMKVTINPATYAGPVKIKPNDGRVTLFDVDTGSAALKTPHAVKDGDILFAEGEKVSSGLADTGFKLDVEGVEPDADHVKITVIEAKLDICKSRTSEGSDPALIAQDKKLSEGRFIHVQAGDHHGRAMLIVQRVKPKQFEGKLVLTPTDAKVDIFKDETGGAALVTPLEIDHDSKYPSKGEKRWAEGTTVSGALRDTGVKLGVKDVEDECDSVAITVVRLKNLQADIPSTPPHTVRAAPVANSPVARHALSLATGALAGSDYDIDFGVNAPLVLMRNSVPAADPIVLTVDVEPAGVDVWWDVQRDTRPAPDGDDPKVIKLSPKAVPKVVRDGGNHQKATLLSDAVGSFHVCAFVDCDGKNKQEFNTSKGKRIDREPFLPMNFVLVNVAKKKDDCAAHQTMNPVHGADGAGGIGIGVSAGSFNMADPAHEAVHMKLTVDVVGGGRDGTLGLDSVFAGWCNNEVAAEDIVATYRDPGPPVADHRRFTMWASNNTSATNIGSAANPTWEFRPGDPAPNVLPPPVLDSGRQPNGAGGDTCCLTSSNISSQNPLAIGQRWVIEAIDSPGDGAASVHPVVAAALLLRFRFHLEFLCTLAFWTNSSKGSGATGDPADRLYAVFGTARWSMNGEWTIDQVAGTRKQITKPKVKLTTSGFSTLQAAVSATTEFLPPTGLDTMAADATT